MKKQVEKETVGVLWSGGLDSTYLVYWLLQHDYKVRAYYSEILNNIQKTKMEQAAIKKLVPIFQNIYKNDFEYRGLIQKMEVLGDTSNENFHQIPIWMISALHFGEPVKRIAIGYVMNDDAISYIDDIHKAWKGLSFLLYRKTKLWFPLVKVKKETMADNLPLEYRQHVVWCEYPKDDLSPCGTCHTCQRSPLVEKPSYPKYVTAAEIKAGDYIMPKQCISSDAVASKVLKEVMS